MIQKKTLFLGYLSIFLSMSTLTLAADFWGAVKAEGYLREDLLNFCEAAHLDFKTLHGKAPGAFLFHKNQNRIFISYLDSLGNFRMSPVPKMKKNPLQRYPDFWEGLMSEVQRFEKPPITEKFWQAFSRASDHQLLKPIEVDGIKECIGKIEHLNLSHLAVGGSGAACGARPASPHTQVNEWEAFMPLICDGDAIVEDGSLPIKRMVLNPVEAEAMISRELANSPALRRAQLHGSQLLHGSSSSSLLAFTQYGKFEGHLMPLGQLEKTGRIAFSGEIAWGRGGMNDDTLSTAWVGQLSSALGYASAAKWSPEKGAQVKASHEGRLVENPGLSRHRPFMNQQEVNEKRLREWGKLLPAEQSLVSDAFPVLYGIKSSRRKVHSPAPSDIPGEVALEDGALHDEIKVVFVPREKIELTREILRERFGKIAVEPLESIKPAAR